MKIAVNTRILLKNKIEGVALFTLEVLKRLVTQHPEHEFIFFFDRPFDSTFIFGENVKPVVLNPQSRHPFLFLVWFEWSVAKALKKYQPDVFLSPDNFLTLSTSIKTVLVTHDIAYKHYPNQLPLIYRWYYKIMTPLFNKKADAIVTVSEFTKEDLVKQLGILSEKISVACNGCDEAFQPLNENEIIQVRSDFSSGQPYFLFVGSIHPRKNIHRLIEAFDAFKKISGSSVKLLLAGRYGWKAGAIKAAYENAIHQKDIIFLGYVSDVELPRLIGGALACTYISLFEGFGIPILQAMHAETPVITSNTSSMPEVAGDAAIIVDPLSVQEIANAMQQIWQDTHLRSILVEKGKGQRAHFTWQKAADKVYNTLNEVVASTIT